MTQIEWVAMASSFSSRSRLDRRIRQLRKESEVVREDIRTLSRALKNRDELDRLPKLKSGKYVEAPAIPPPTRGDPVRKPVAGVPAMPPKMIEQAVDEGAQPAGAAFPQREPKAGVPPISLPGAGPVRSQPPVKDERFANLFSSGGFLGSVNVRQERNVQKNKAIFMLLVVIVVFFVVYKLVF